MTTGSDLSRVSKLPGWPATTPVNRWTTRAPVRGVLPLSVGYALCLACVLIAVPALVTMDLAALAARASATNWGAGAVLLLYAGLLALPFVPGAEIGIALLVLFGVAMALPVYVATVLGLSLAFLAGRRAAPRAAGPGLAEEPGTPDRFASLRVAVGTLRWFAPVMRFRWVAVIVLINTPGNTVIGGGGGIAMAAGYSRAFPFPMFLASIAVAVAPVPLAVLLAEYFGLGIGLEHWVQDVARNTPVLLA